VARIARHQKAYAANSASCADSGQRPARSTTTEPSAVISGRAARNSPTMATCTATAADTATVTVPGSRVVIRERRGASVVPDEADVSGPGFSEHPTSIRKLIAAVRTISPISTVVRPPAPTRVSASGVVGASMAIARPSQNTNP
jgi:hypothetical protein